MMLQMHLKIYESPLTADLEEENIENNNWNTDILESVQQLEARIKILENALQQTQCNGNKLIDCIEMLQRSKAIDKAADDGNNITQDSKAGKRTHNESDLNDEQHNDIENVASGSDSDSEDHHTCTITAEEQQEVIDLRHKCVYIQNFYCSDASLNRAFCNIHKLAIEMKAQIANNSVIHIDVDLKKDNYLDYYVYFRDTDSKIEFLRNRFIYKYNPNTKHYLRILDYSRCGIVDIKNYKSTDLSSDTASVNVLGLAKKMRLTYIRNFIDNIDVYSTKPNFLTYSVRFNREDMKNAFLQRKDILKEFEETKFLELADVGGHTLSCDNVNNFSMAIASANVIGLAEIMSLSLANDNIKRIYVLNTKLFASHTNRFRLALIVHFASKPIKDEFLKRKYKLEQIENINRYSIKISNIQTEEDNVIIIKYGKFWSNDLIAISFIGLAKQLGLSLTCHQINCFITLLDFTYKACTTSPTYDL